ncbi:carbohydrate-binding module family 13 protein, partial [Laccaria bicolor S238N-H82]
TTSTITATPTPTGVQIHPNSNNTKCMDVAGNIRQNGTPVQIFDCNGSSGQRWNITRGLTKVQLAGTNFCLDAGLPNLFGNGDRLKIWQCIDTIPAQTWAYTNQNQILLLATEPSINPQCVDLPDGQTFNGNQLQTFQCSPLYANQIWTTTS